MTYIDKIPIEIWLHIFQLGCEIDEDPWAKLPTSVSKFPAGMPPVMYFSVSHMRDRLHGSREPQLKYFAAKMAMVCRSWRSVVKDVPSNLWYIDLHVGNDQLARISKIESELTAFPGSDIDIHFHEPSSDRDRFRLLRHDTPSSPPSNSPSSATPTDTPRFERFMGMITPFKSRVRLIELASTNPRIISAINNWDALVNLECIGIRPSGIARGLTFFAKFAAPSLRHVSLSRFSHQDLIEMQRALWGDVNYPSASAETDSTPVAIALTNGDRRGPVIHITGFDVIPHDVVAASTLVLQHVKSLCVTSGEFRNFSAFLKNVELPDLKTLKLTVSDFSPITNSNEFKTFPSLTTLLVKTRPSGKTATPPTSAILQYFRAPNLRNLCMKEVSESLLKDAEMHLLCSFEHDTDQGPERLLVNVQTSDFNMQDLKPLIKHARITHLLFRSKDESHGSVSCPTLILSQHTCEMQDLERLSLYRSNSHSVFESIEFSSIALKIRKLDLGGSLLLESAKEAMARLPNVSELSLEIHRVYDIRLVELLSEGDGSTSKDLSKTIQSRQWRPKVLSHLERLEIYWQDLSDAALTGLGSRVLPLLARRSQLTQAVKYLVLPSNHGFDAAYLDKIKTLHVEVSFTASSPFQDFELDKDMDDYFRY